MRKGSNSSTSIAGVQQLPCDLPLKPTVPDDLGEHFIPLLQSSDLVLVIIGVNEEYAFIVCIIAGARDLQLTYSMLGFLCY